MKYSQSPFYALFFIFTILVNYKEQAHRVCGGVGLGGGGGWAGLCIVDKISYLLQLKPPTQDLMQGGVWEMSDVNTPFSCSLPSAPENNP